MIEYVPKNDFEKIIEELNSKIEELKGELKNDATDVKSNVK